MMNRKLFKSLVSHIGYNVYKESATNSGVPFYVSSIALKQTLKLEDNFNQQRADNIYLNFKQVTKAANFLIVSMTSIIVIRNRGIPKGRQNKNKHQSH